MYYVDVAYKSIIKDGEELCGDNVESAKFRDYSIVTLSDGLGSGVKANILATLTSKIAVTMLKEGTRIEDTIDTIAHTLPVCSERNIAYSTFTIIKAKSSGHVYIAEFDGPSFFLHRNGKSVPVNKTSRVINGKTVYESNFYMNKDMQLTVISDGVINASEGMILNYDWDWDNINDFLGVLSKDNESASEVCSSLMDVCQALYDDRPGDDATVLVLKMCERRTVNLMIGPPKNPKNDRRVVSEFLKKDGKRVVCGGTTAKIVSRQLGKDMKIDVTTMTEEIPPIGYIDGVDLVLEGAVTISGAVKLMSAYLDSVYNKKAEKMIKENNGASMLANMLINECSDLNIFMGQAVNEANRDTEFVVNFNYKESRIKELIRLMEKMGKKVTFTYT